MPPFNYKDLWHDYVKPTWQFLDTYSPWSIMQRDAQQSAQDFKTKMGWSSWYDFFRPHPDYDPTDPLQTTPYGSWWWNLETPFDASTFTGQYQSPTSTPTSGDWEAPVVSDVPEGGPGEGRGGPAGRSSGLYKKMWDTRMGILAQQARANQTAGGESGLPGDEMGRVSDYDRSYDPTGRGFYGDTDYYNYVPEYGYVWVQDANGNWYRDTSTGKRRNVDWRQGNEGAWVGPRRLSNMQAFGRIGSTGKASGPRAQANRADRRIALAKKWGQLPYDWQPSDGLPGSPSAPPTDNQYPPDDLSETPYMGGPGELGLVNWRP